MSVVYVPPYKRFIPISNNSSPRSNRRFSTNSSSNRRFSNSPRSIHSSSPRPRFNSNRSSISPSPNPRSRPRFNSNRSSKSRYNNTNNTNTKKNINHRISSRNLKKISEDNGFIECQNIKKIATYWNNNYGGSFIDKTRTGYYLSPFKKKLDYNNHIHIFKSKNDITNAGIILIKYNNKHYIQYHNICLRTIDEIDIKTICDNIYYEAHYNLITNPKDINNNYIHNNKTIKILNSLPEPRKYR